MTVPDTMIAARLVRHGGPEALEVVEVPVPSPGEREVSVKISAAALNNTDLWTREGAYGLAGGAGARAGWRGTVEFPRIQGADVVGTVVQTGPGVDSRLLDSRVLVDPAFYDRDDDAAYPVGLLGSERDGGYADYVVVLADRVHHVEDSPLSDIELACLPIAYGTALGMLERGGVQRGHTVVVTGASGGVGLALVQLATARGATVIAASSIAKAAAVQHAGASEVVDRAADTWGQIAKAVPNGVDVVLDVVAGDGITSGLSSVRDGGRWVVAGALGGYAIDLDVRRLYLHNIALIGSSMHTPAHFRTLVDLARQGQIHPVVAATYTLADVHQAQADLATRHHVGKLVLVHE